MKAKNISTRLKTEIYKWIATIDDPEVRSLAYRNVIVTGGSIVSLLTDEKVNDYDIYFRTKDAAAAVAIYYIKKYKENPPEGAKDIDKIWAEVTEDRVKIQIPNRGISGITEDAEGMSVEEVEEIAEKLTEGKPYRPLFISSNAITLSDRIQIIVRFFGEPDKIHENYDFVHCTNYWTAWDDRLELRKEALEAILTHELRYIGSKYPVCSIFRLRKFLKRGWHISAGQLLKIIVQVADLDLNDWEVLEDQLTGVDASYFRQAIALLREKVDQGETIDRQYLFEVLDLVF